ncbi:MAG TPA: hypothetical protein DEP84_31170, partial [Chloroflexi bacterium]|nr:hypothetical protein [Chloroflexota bacterium]
GAAYPAGWNRQQARALAMLRARLKRDRWDPTIALRPKPKRTYQRKAAYAHNSCLHPFPGCTQELWGAGPLPLPSQGRGPGG